MMASSNGFAAICRLIGSPFGEVENPADNTSAGNPHTLNIRRNGCLTSTGSPAGAGIPGVRNTSRPRNTAASSFTNRVRTLYSKSLDDGASALGGNDFNSEGGGSRYLFSKDRGLSPFDLRHSFVTNANYTLPFAATANGVKAIAAKDWTIGMLVRMRSGYPFSGISGVDTGLQVQGWAPEYPDLKPGASSNPVLGTVDRWFDPNAFVLPPAGYIGTLPRNSIIGPDLKTVDLIVGKGITLGSRRELQVRFECFNLLNRANFGLPQSQVFNTNGTIREDAGRITTTSTAARQIHGVVGNGEDRGNGERRRRREREHTEKRSNGVADVHGNRRCIQLGEE
jgi:hypothetical protein